MRGEFSALRGETRAGDEEARRQLREGDEETRRFMHILHEDVIARISMLQERLPRPRKKRDYGLERNWQDTRPISTNSRRGCVP